MTQCTVCLCINESCVIVSLNIDLLCEARANIVGERNGILSTLISIFLFMLFPPPQQFFPFAEYLYLRLN